MSIKKQMLFRHGEMGCELAHELRRCAHQLERGVNPDMTSLLSKIAHYRGMQLQSLPLDIKLKILSHAFPQPFSFSSPNLAKAATFLDGDRQPGMIQWVGPAWMRRKHMLYMILLQCMRKCELMTDCMAAARMVDNAHVFVTSDDGSRVAVAFYEFGIGIHGPFGYLDNDDIDRILRMQAVSMQSVSISAHRSIMAKSLRDGMFSSFFTIGITLEKGYHPIHAVESTPFYNAKLHCA